MSVNSRQVDVFSVTFNPASVAAATTAEQALTVPGVRIGDVVVLNKPTLTAGVGVVGSRVSDNDTVMVTFVNATAAAVDPGSEVYLVAVFRK